MLMIASAVVDPKAESKRLMRNRLGPMTWLLLVSLVFNLNAVEASAYDGSSPLRLRSVEDGNDRFERWSDIGLGAAVLSGIIGSLWLSVDGDNTEQSPYLAAPIVDFAAALALNNAITFGLKSGVNRPRPYTSSPNFPAGTGVNYSQAQIDDAHRSFPSGHTSNTAASLFALATTTQLYEPTSPSKPWLVASLYTVATASTIFVGQMRVDAGYHFHSDVIIGGLIGAATGMGIPFLNCFLFADEPVSTISAAGSSSTPHHPVRLSFNGSWLDFVGRF